jgi:CDP-diacylglycerol--glycerol-3-phosphate 3-phosphatidyltransferase
MFWTIPTLMTWTRIVELPLIVGVFYAPLDPATRNLIATVMFVVFAATDWLDGYLARKLNQTSSFGAFLDPVADKFLVCASLLVLVHLQRADVFVALIIIGREIAISALREWMAQIGASKSVAVHMIGKVKTTVQMIAIPFLLYDGRVGHLADLGFRRAHGLVHGLLPAKGVARDPRAREVEPRAWGPRQGVSAPRAALELGCQYGMLPIRHV